MKIVVHIEKEIEGKAGYISFCKDMLNTLVDTAKRTNVSVEDTLEVLWMWLLYITYENLEEKNISNLHKLSEDGILRLAVYLDSIGQLMETEK